MKLIVEYLEHAVHFERLANAERDSTFKAMMMDQAKRYLELAKLRIGPAEPGICRAAEKLNLKAVGST